MMIPMGELLAKAKKEGYYDGWILLSRCSTLKRKCI